ncbi:Hypothetical_protein [Hexamita inflata]|uniref:Hypothetical_protein n=1 Tax=Hexamita inflata TaxID=28002 RepID=A0AA86NUZ7_9EUKA|nr:Hypothetical protein HINF_LOCUS14330 [Hexamita inflata]CAI9926690.1 Hypothetical protein HINF_LOCUS14335 [Hexamita inflata]CAI9960659.1 Hypothetical protein HINF_LOCUS48304 [Hexamita inflata]
MRGKGRHYLSTAEIKLFAHSWETQIHIIKWSAKRMNAQITALNLTWTQIMNIYVMSNQSLYAQSEPPSHICLSHHCPESLQLIDVLKRVNDQIIAEYCLFLAIATVGQKE